MWKPLAIASQVTNQDIIIVFSSDNIMAILIRITAADNIGEIFCIGFCIHDAASSYWVSWFLLGLSYKVYGNKSRR